MDYKSPEYSNYVFHKGFKIIKCKFQEGMYQVDPMHGAALSKPMSSVQECKNVIDKILLKIKIK